MSEKQTGRFCNHCNTNVMATGTKPNHLLHLFLTVITLGLWVIVWIIRVIVKSGV